MEWPWVGGGHFEVAPDGTLWYGTTYRIEGDDASACDGVASFDGTMWSRHLRNRCVQAMEFTADGSVWVLATDEGPVLDEGALRDDQMWHIYVITPEAVAAAE